MPFTSYCSAGQWLPGREMERPFHAESTAHTVIQQPTEIRNVLHGKYTIILIVRKDKRIIKRMHKIPSPTKKKHNYLQIQLTDTEHDFSTEYILKVAGRIRYWILTETNIH